MAQVLLDLVALMADAAAKIDAACKARGAAFPTLDGPLGADSEAIRSDAVVAAGIDILAAAAHQIIATARAPTRTIMDSAYTYHTSSAIRTAAAVNAAEVLRAAGPKGAHVRDIVAGTAVAPSKIARVLRLLAAQHIFKEVSPDVFANNRLSAVLDTGKDIADLRANPAQRHDGTNGVLALIESGLDAFYKAGPYLTEALTDPATAAAQSPSEAPFNLALRTSDDFWTWMERPEQAAKLRRFGIAMQGAKSLVSEGHLAQGFDWNEVPKDATVVDVGGGTGHVSMALAKEFPHLKLVVQDRPRTIEQGHQYWKENMPQAIESGRVQLQGHDFFQSQPARDVPVAVFMMRFIIHDWADSYAAKIMRALRDAAAPTTRLIVIERLVPYACPVDEGALGIPGAKSTVVVPAPLLPNLGIVSWNCYFGDFQMLNAINGQERTLLQFKELFERGGWKLERVYRMPGFTAQLIGSPA